MNKPELLAPAGNLNKLKTAIIYGADAVYFGGERFSLRNASDNFTRDDIKRGVDFVKNHGKKIYAAVNVIMKNEDIDGVYSFIQDVADLGVDGVIVADLGAVTIAKEVAPQLNVHISTQANTTNYKSALAWHKLGAKRIVLARELSEIDIKQIRKNTPDSLELEAFVHGAMCISYSGRCLLSNYMAGRDANQGDCAHPCRWKYSLMEEQRPGQYFPVYENDRGSFFFNSKDLCLIEFIPQLINAGINTFKIEGRVKSEFYVATVVKAYREEIDRYCENSDTYQFDQKQLEELCKVSHREYTHGFWHDMPHSEGQVYKSSSYVRDYDIVGIIIDCDENGNAHISQRNKFSVGDEIEILRPKGDFIQINVTQMADEKDEQIQTAPHAGMVVKMNVGAFVPPLSMLRKRRAVLIDNETCACDK
ncbi:MAG: U32 family peptidase [Clostridiaceae bacterium]|jgi:putative protease|nr:U32 family peptidase [Clostridiaceae bacterium]